jgi:hypothetical protein
LSNLFSFYQGNGGLLGKRHCEKIDERLRGCFGANVNDGKTGDDSVHHAAAHEKEGRRRSD